MEGGNHASGSSGFSRGTLLSTAAPAPPPPRVLNIEWTELHPVNVAATGSPLLGSGLDGVVVRADWTRAGSSRRVPCAVKVWKLRSRGVSAASYGSVLARLDSEVAMLQDVVADGGADVIVNVLGRAEGVAPAAWTAALGDEADWVQLRVAGGVSAAARVQIGMVMRYEGGGDLAALIHGPPSWGAPLAERLRIVLEVARGVEHLHNGRAARIVHGDIKPGNVLLSADAPPHARLADFGFAEVKEVISAAAGAGGGVSQMSTATVERGTRAYMAPEMVRAAGAASAGGAAAKASRSTDVYALGTLAWEVLSGRRPWAGCADFERDIAVRRGDTLPLDALPANVPEAVRAAIAASLSLDRAARPPIDALVSAFAAALDVLTADSFHAFISYAWGRPTHWRLPLVDRLYAELTRARLRVWRDVHDLGHNINEGMRRGIAASAVVVLLASPDYEASSACTFEIETALELRKPIVVLLVEPPADAPMPWLAPGAAHRSGWLQQDGSGGGERPNPLGRLGLGAKLADRLYFDLGRAAAVNWLALGGVPPDEAALLSTEVPGIVALVRSLLPVGAEDGLDADVRALERDVSAAEADLSRRITKARLVERACADAEGAFFHEVSAAGQSAYAQAVAAAGPTLLPAVAEPPALSRAGSSASAALSVFAPPPAGTPRGAAETSSADALAASLAATVTRAGESLLAAYEARLSAASFADPPGSRVVEIERLEREHAGHFLEAAGLRALMADASWPLHDYERAGAVIEGVLRPAVARELAGSAGGGDRGAGGLLARADALLASARLTTQARAAPHSSTPRGTALAVLAGDPLVVFRSSLASVEAELLLERLRPAVRRVAVVTALATTTPPAGAVGKGCPPC